MRTRNSLTRGTGVANRETKRSILREGAARSGFRDPEPAVRGQRALKATSDNGKSNATNLLLPLLLASAYVIWFALTNSATQWSQNNLLFLGVGVGACIALGVEVSARAYSLMAMNWLFVILFVAIAGFQQYVRGVFIYPGLSSDSRVNAALLCVVVWCTSVGVGSLLFRAKRHGKVSHQATLINVVRVDPKFMRLGTLVSLSSVAYLLTRGGLAILTSRDSAWNALYTDSTVTMQLLSVALRNLPLYCFVLSIIISRRIKGGRFHLAVQGICCLVANSPTNTARFQVATVVFGLAILVAPRFWRGARFTLFFLATFVLAFPILNIFRRDSFVQDLFVSGSPPLWSGVGDFTGGDYDAFTMILYSLRFIADHGLSYGRQVLGPLLFFVPRSIWPGKPIGTGATILSYYGYDFTNVSAPFIAEGLVNFGLLGVALFGVVLGVASGALDDKYWNLHKVEMVDGGFFDGFYPFLLALVFFLNRGDMLSGLSYAISHAVSFAAVWLVAHHFFADQARDAGSSFVDYSPQS